MILPTSSNLIVLHVHAKRRNDTTSGNNTTSELLNNRIDPIKNIIIKLETKKIKLSPGLRPPPFTTTTKTIDSHHANKIAKIIRIDRIRLLR
ncbi:hypothetical protein THICB3560298 [Thiomonas sp. CB3]|nr:hypothetical protein THICB3560298 [Thiomonas sp. CB3]